jgi:NADPH-dependent 2,4-dienoyl-CoA reductase/sulfur reductase-like enzyme
VLVLDEYPQPGGQFYKQRAPGLDLGEGRVTLDGEYSRGDALLAAVRACGVELWQDALVWATFAPHRLCVSRSGESATVQARCTIIAAGAHERSIAFKGWDLPGVMTPGAAQTLVKHQSVVAGKRIVLGGSGPFLAPVAKTLIDAGANIVAIVEATRPSEWLRHAPHCWGHWERLREALAYRRMIARAGIPITFGARIVEARGRESVESVVVNACDRDGAVLPEARPQEIEADTVCVGYGFVPNIQLASALGCALDFDALRGGWIARHDEAMQTSSDSVFVAGEAAGIGGAYSALAEGKLAGLCAARKLGLDVSERAIAEVRRERAHRRRFADALNAMFPVKPGYYRGIDDATLICRCEEVSAGEVRAAIAAWGDDVNCVKGHTRCGMGYCQGRICAASIDHLLAQALGRLPGASGAFTIRPPIKPVPVALLAELEP